MVPAALHRLVLSRPVTALAIVAAVALLLLSGHPAAGANDQAVNAGGALDPAPPLDWTPPLTGASNDLGPWVEGVDYSHYETLVTEPNCGTARLRNSLLMSDEGALNIRFRIQQDLIDLGYEPLVLEAARTWEASGAAIRFTYLGATQSKSVIGNGGVVPIFFSSLPIGIGAEANMARSFATNASTCWIDPTFVGESIQVTSVWHGNWGPGDLFVELMTHEFGHILGLDHPKPWSTAGSAMAETYDGPGLAPVDVFVVNQLYPRCASEAATFAMEGSSLGGWSLDWSGNDVIVGSSGNDSIDAGRGDDSVCGLGGNDSLRGGPGDDRLFGAQGNDNLFGDDGDDVLHGNNGADSLSGGEGDDRAFGYAGDDTIIGGNGADRLHGHFGNDTITGGAGNDRVFGYGGDDQLFGGSGNDLMSGNFGSDELNGGDGDDEMYGADGDDTLTGGIGNDVIEGNSSNDELFGGDGNDDLDGGIGFDWCNGQGGVDASTRCERATGVP